MKYDAVFFDLDGTLADTLADIAHLMNQTLAKHGWPGHTTDAYRQFVGDGVHKLVERALPADQHDHIAEIVAEYLPLLTDHGVERATLYPRIDAMLDALSQRDLKLAVLSNKPHDATKVAVAKLMGRWDFALVQGQIANKPPKPDPTLAHEMAAQLHIAPSRIIYLGDSNVDMRLAKNAGFTAVGAGWGFRGETELRANGAKFVVHDPMDLLPLLD